MAQGLIFFAFLIKIAISESTIFHIKSEDKNK